MEIFTYNDGNGIKLVDFGGEIIDSSDMLGMFIYFLHQKGYKGSVVKTSAVSGFVDKIATKLGIRVIDASNIEKEIIKDRIDVLVAGDERGNIFVGGLNRFSLDAIVSGLMALWIVSSTEKSLSEYKEEIEKNVGGEVYYQKEEIELVPELRKEASKILIETIEGIKKGKKFSELSIFEKFSQLKAGKIEDISATDGVKVKFKDGSWIFIRLRDSIMELFVSADNLGRRDELLGIGKKLFGTEKLQKEIEKLVDSGSEIFEKEEVSGKRMLPEKAVEGSILSEKFRKIIDKFPELQEEDIKIIEDLWSNKMEFYGNRDIDIETLVFFEDLVERIKNVQDVAVREKIRDKLSMLLSKIYYSGYKDWQLTFEKYLYETPERKFVIKDVVRPLDTELERLIRENDILIFGEDHRYLSERMFLISYMRKLKEMGVTHIVMEGLDNAERVNITRNRVVFNTRYGAMKEIILRAAREAGIEVVFGDMSIQMFYEILKKISPFAAKSLGKEFTFQELLRAIESDEVVAKLVLSARNRYWANVVKSIKRRNPDAKIVFQCGANHLADVAMGFEYKYENLVSFIGALRKSDLKVSGFELQVDISLDKPYLREGKGSNFVSLASGIIYLPADMNYWWERVSGDFLRYYLKKKEGFKEIIFFDWELLKDVIKPRIESVPGAYLFIRLLRESQRENIKIVIVSNAEEKEEIYKQLEILVPHIRPDVIKVSSDFSLRGYIDSLGIEEEVPVLSFSKSDEFFKEERIENTVISDKKELLEKLKGLLDLILKTQSVIRKTADKETKKKESKEFVMRGQRIDTIFSLEKTIEQTQQDRFLKDVVESISRVLTSGSGTGFFKPPVITEIFIRAIGIDISELDIKNLSYDFRNIRESMSST